MDDDFHIPAAKRQKLEVTSNADRRQGSRLFAPFRTIGLVSPTRVPFTSTPLGQTTFQITTSVGRSLQTYDLRRGLNLVFLTSPLCLEAITSTCAYRDRVFTAWGSDTAPNGRGVWVFKRGKQIGALQQEGTIPQELRNILIFGNWIVGCGLKGIDVWRQDSYDHYTSITPSTSHSHTSVLSGDLCTLPTFINKVFAGRLDGSIDVYNVSTGKLVHTILGPASNPSAITCLAAAPSVGLIAAAWADGNIKILDVETEDAILSFSQGDANHPVTCITFRSDGAGAGEDGRSDGVMATASIESGDITLWELNGGGKVAGILRSAHETSNSLSASGISGIEFLSGQPVLVSSGLDNALKSWIFDQVPFSPLPRILHSRSGHASAISSLKFLPAATDGSEANGKWLLSAGLDRSLWGFSLRKDGQSAELSQGKIKSKAKKVGKVLSDETNVEDFKCPPIIAIACSLNRDGGMGAVGGPVWTNPSTNNAEESNMTGWESVLTAHENDKFARTWLWGRKKAGRWAFQSGDQTPVTSVAITTCGTFALVGSAGGSLDMHNLQSGAHRQRFPAKLKAGHAKQLKQGSMKPERVAGFIGGHTDAIKGIVVDNMNQTVISASLDGLVIFWDFSTGLVLSKMRLDGSPTAVRYNPIAGLMSIACDDLCIRVIDIETRKIVRELWGCIGQIFDHCFSHDGRWVIACSMDSVIRVFDLATGHLIDAFKTATCTNLAFSSTGEFLATAHAGNIGINIWNNKSLYMALSSRQVDEGQELIDLTDAAAFQGASQLANVDVNAEQGPTFDVDSHDTMEQLDASLLTLSLMPQSRWQTLLNLETVRQRNKPIQPPQKPKATPFFLGSTIGSGMPKTSRENFAIEPKEPGVTEEEKSRISRLSSLQPVQSVFATYLDEFEHQGNTDDLISYLAGLSPSAADLEIRSLSMQEMPVFVNAMTAHLRNRRDYELINTWMAVFLRLHAEFASEINDIRSSVLTYQQAMNCEASRLSQSVGWTRGVVEFLRSSR